jgi:ATP-dependent Clp protease ATP-binding subunit ClpC
MAKVNVYLPDDLEQAVREAGLPISSVCQAALRDALGRAAALRTTGRGHFTPRLDEVLAAASEEAASRGRQVGALDLLGAVLDHGENLGARALAAAGIELPEPGFLRRGRATGRKGAGELSPEARAALADAYAVALELGHDYVGTEHLVVALAAGEGPAGRTLAALGADPATLRRQVLRLIANPWAAAEATPREPTLERLDAEVRRLASEIDRLRGAGR